MELYEVMRTTGAVREFTSEPLPDAALDRILDNARFALAVATGRGRGSSSSAIGRRGSLSPS